MEIVVQARNVELDPEVERESHRKVEKLSRLANDIRRAEVEFSEIRNPRESEPHVCDLVLHLTGTLVKAQAAAPEARTALDRAVHKAHHQLERVHNKRVARSHPR